MSLTNRVRQPEYTGENRCVPCTSINVVIAIGMSALAAIASTLLGISVFTLSLGTIYLRGYLVPGTPMLTKRYFPEHVLQWFDKDTTVPITDEPDEIDPERTLLDANAVEPCREDSDLCLTAEFQQAWHERISSAHVGEDYLADALNVSDTDDQLTVDQQDDAFVAYINNAVVGQWSSQAAVIADVAAATELSERISYWSDFTPAEIACVLMSVRIFIEQCPDCDGPVQVEQEVVESCCQSHDVIASVCQNCNERLFEIEWNGTATDGTSEQLNQSA